MSRLGRGWRPALLGALLLAMYAEVVVSLAVRWWEDDGYSHGLLVAPLAAYLAWRQRAALRAQAVLPDRRGLLAILAACLLYVTGKLGAEFFLTRLSLVVMAAGLIWTFWGRARLRRLLFPLLLVLSSIPLPVLVYNKIAGPLQLLASSASTELAQWLGVSVYRDGNIIYLADATLGVAEACSGLRSISSLAVAALLLSYMELRRPGTRLTLLLLALPIAIGFNVLRVAGTALLSERDPALGSGFYHGFSGWLIFLAGFGALWLGGRGLRHCFEAPRRETTA